MKALRVESTTLDACVDEAQHERVVLTQDGRPVAVVVGVEGLDMEQVELGSSETLRRLMTERRQQGTIDRAELEHRLAESDARRS